MGSTSTRVGLPLAILIVAMATMFTLDLVTPVGVTIHILYFPLLMIAALCLKPRIAWSLFAVCVVLIAIGAFYSPQALPEGHVWLAKTMHLAAIPLAALIVWITLSVNRSQTALREAVETLRLSEREFRTLAENLPDVVARYDRQFRHVYLNRAIERATGIPVEAFLGKTHPETGIPPDIVQQFLATEHEVFATRRPQVIESVMHRPDGTRHFESRLVPEFGSDGSVETVLCISRDVTERVRAQERDDLHLAELAHASRLSTIGGLVSEIAHEINQPLHAIVNFAQASINVLEKTPSDQRPNLFGWLSQISEQANRAAGIIRRAGRFARKAPLRRSTVNVNAVVRDCLNLLNFDLRLNHVKLQIELADDVPLLLADTVQILQVLVNLMRNAVEAMSENDEDDRNLIVHTAGTEDTVQVSVCDNGAGLDTEARAKLFEPFFTTKPEGLGLGLAVCQSIVQAHAGRLWAEPNSDRGITFHFALPIRSEVPHNVTCHV